MNVNTIQNRHNSARRNCRGQSLVEFAIAFPIQLLLVFGIMQMAFLFVSTAMVDLAAYRCARAALVGEHTDYFGTWTINNTGSNTSFYGDDFTGVDRVAQITLAPIAGTSKSAGDSGPPVAVIPGWGEIERSEYSGLKTQVRVIEPESDDVAPSENVVTVIVEYNQEMFFPFVDDIMKWILRNREGGLDATRQHTFGRDDEEYVGSLHQGDIALEDSERGRIRMLGDRPHVVITRRCSLYRGAAVPYEY